MSAAPYWGGVHLIPLGINPLSLPNLLWWDDVGSIVPRPANGAFVATVPTYPGTPTTVGGVGVAMHEAQSEFPGTYAATDGPVGSIVMANAGYNHSGPAFTIYAQSSSGGLTFYHRFRVDNNAPTFGSEPILRTTAGAAVFSLNLGNNGAVSLTGGGFATLTVGTLTVGAWHTVAITCDREPGTLHVYLDGLLVASEAETGIAIETTNGGVGLSIGAVQPVAGFRWNTTIGYQAVHNSATVKGVTKWLAAHR